MLFGDWIHSPFGLKSSLAAIPTAVSQLGLWLSTPHSVFFWENWFPGESVLTEIATQTSPLDKLKLEILDSDMAQSLLYTETRKARDGEARI